MAKSRLLPSTVQVDAKQLQRLVHERNEMYQTMQNALSILQRIEDWVGAAFLFGKEPLWYPQLQDVRQEVNMVLTSLKVKEEEATNV